MGEAVRILVVDDELHVRTSLAIWLREEGYEVVTASSGAEALEMISHATPDILMVDIKMPGMDGLEVLRRAKRISPEATIVLMTAYAAVDTAVQALKDGAYDYIVKPFDPEHVSRLVRKAAAQHAMVSENRELRDRLEAALPPLVAAAGGLMADAVEQAEQVAPTGAHVLIEGEPGSGKELLARHLHAHSRRILGPLVRIDCEGSTDALLAELVGQERGSLPAAEPPRRGKLELAHEGTLLVRALDCASLPVQHALERALATRKAIRSGAHAGVDADFRLLATSSRDLETLVDEGRFSAELFSRLRSCRIGVPPLRARAEDIPRIAADFLEHLARQAQRPVVALSAEALSVLAAQPWPGNVSELREALRRAVDACDGTRILPVHLPFLPRRRDPAFSLARMEENHIRQVFEMFGHDVVRTASELGIEPVVLEEKLLHYGIRRP